MSNDVLAFDCFRARSLLWWIPLSAASFLLVYGIDPEVHSRFITAIWIWASLVGWVLWKSWRCEISLRCLFGPTLLQKRAWLLVGLVFPVIAFKVGSSWLVPFLLSYVVPEYAASFLNDAGVNSTLDEKGMLWKAGFFLSAVVATPISEELVFRGVLVNRWTRKWSAPVAVVASSLAFALLHGNAVGSFASGTVAATLYLQTRSLLLPIVYHAANNAIAFGAGILTESAEGVLRQIIVGPSTISALRAGWGTGLISLGLSLPILAYFFYTHWPTETDAVAPYRRNQDRHVA